MEYKVVFYKVSEGTSHSLRNWDFHCPKGLCAWRASEVDTLSVACQMTYAFERGLCTSCAGGFDLSRRCGLYRVRAHGGAPDTVPSAERADPLLGYAPMLCSETTGAYS